MDFNSILGAIASPIGGALFGMVSGGLLWGLLGWLYTQYKIQDLIAGNAGQLFYKLGKTIRKQYIDKIPDEAMRNRLIQTLDTSTEVMSKEFDRGIHDL